MADGEAAEQELGLADSGYPPPLRQIADPPARLFVRGQLALEMAAGRTPLEPAVAVVGARDATVYGLGVARDLARQLAERGIVVVSGLAPGIDGAAHRGALEAGGRTVAVVGAGTDVVYPRCHARLREAILATGAVLAELPAGKPPLRHHFPARNRLISGLSLGVVVVEGTLRSGSLGTAHHALEQGREIFAVPGPVTSPRSRGPHWLLKAGARLVETADDIAAELAGLLGRGAPRGHDALRQAADSARQLFALLAEGVSTVDQLAARSGREVAEIWRDLLDLEMRGAILRGPGGTIAVAARASAGDG